MIHKDVFRNLPIWAKVAFVARCARRFVEVYENDKVEPAASRAAVVQAVQIAEARAAIGGNDLVYSEQIELAGQFFDNYDIESLRDALHGFAVAAENTHTDLREDASVEPHVRRTFVSIWLAGKALEVAFPTDTSSLNIDDQIDQVVKTVLYGEPELKESIELDSEQLQSLAIQKRWSEFQGVSPKDFNDLWASGKPTAWPPQTLTFRPRARIIRTIGDRLISGPEAAVIELVKNSYDADASLVRITFFPSSDMHGSEILFEDDGHGMSLSDIQQKWMEPATSDKRDRKTSLLGRPLLGSKGIGRFAAARLGQYLELISTSKLANSFLEDGMEEKKNKWSETTKISKLDWNLFEEVKYLDDVAFPVKSSYGTEPVGTSLRVWNLRDDWSEQRLVKLHQELRRLISPINDSQKLPFQIILDLSRCKKDVCGFDGLDIVQRSGRGFAHDAQIKESPFEIRPFPILEACDYSVDGIFDEAGNFDGTMTIRRAGQEPEPIKLTVPMKDDESEQSCGVVLVKLNVFDREAESIRSTAAKAGFGEIGVREARKLLDNIAGVAIYREGFRIRPYGDGENDWLTLDAKRVQNPTMKIGRNQIAGVVVVDDEESSDLLERSSREGLEENGSFHRLQTLILTLLAEIVEPRRRQFRISAGLDVREETSFRQVYERVQLGWSKLLLAKIPEADRPEVEELITRESDRLTHYVKRLEDRQAQLEAQVTLGLIIGEVMHQGNTPLSFIETEVSRLLRWWATLFNESSESSENRIEVPRILNGMKGSSATLRTLFNSLSPLSGARRGQPTNYAIAKVVADTQYLFQTKLEKLGIKFSIDSEVTGLTATGYIDDLATALTNLIDNSIYWLEHHNVPNPSIRISGTSTQSESRSRSEIFVADNGAGIPEEFREQLFDIGFTLKPSGTGLGLSIAKEAIFRSGGELTLVDSDIGARFAIVLPS